jgi:phosphatidylglycerophosphate synthase
MIITLLGAVVDPAADKRRKAWKTFGLILLGLAAVVLFVAFYHYIGAPIHKG